MDTLTFPVNVATMIATPATVLMMMTKQVFAFEDPKQCNTDGWLSCSNVGYNDGRQS